MAPATWYVQLRQSLSLTLYNFVTTIANRDGEPKVAEYLYKYSLIPQCAVVHEC